MKTLIQDLRYSLRQFRHNPGFAVTATTTMMLAIGVSVAAFCVLYAVLLRPLPYNHPEEIVYVSPSGIRGGWIPASYPEYTDWRRENQCFSALAGYSERNINFEGPGGAVALKNVSTTDNFFDVFGVKPIRGRTFAAGEDQPGKNDIAVLSHEVWRQHFGARKDTVGQTIRLDGKPYTVIGIMPAGFQYPLGKRNAVYTPLHMNKVQRYDLSHWLPTVARLKAGVSLSQAQQDMNRVLTNLERSRPASGWSVGRSITLVDLNQHVTKDSAPTLKILVWAVLAILAIGCTNVGSLLLSRSVKREREMALRTAIGASRLRIVRQLLTETTLLGLAGALGGTLLAYGLIQVIRALLIDSLARGVEIGVNSAALLVALGLALITTLSAGLLPALRLSATAPNVALKASGHAGTARSQHRLRAAFVMFQVALAFALIVTSGLLMRVLHGLRNTELGFDPDHLLTTEISLSPGAWEGRDALTSFYTPLLKKVQAIPGVVDAGLIDHLPIQYQGFNGDIQIAGQPPAPLEQNRLSNFRWVTSGYFKAFGISLIRGRMLDESIDGPGSPALVVNDAFVRKFFPTGEDPIGKNIENWGTIVGVVRSVRQSMYEPPEAEIDNLLSTITPQNRFSRAGNTKLVIHTSVKPESIIPTLRRVFQEVDPGTPFRTPETMREISEDVLSFSRLQNWVFGTFAGLAFLLAVVGLYGLISHEVELSTQETGVRMALGASRLRVVRGIYLRVSLMLLGGLTAGLVTILMVKKLLAAVIVISPARDAALIAGLAAGLLFAGLLAAFVPARRAASIDPMLALRCE
jgi:predicted permease